MTSPVIDQLVQDGTPVKCYSPQRVFSMWTIAVILFLSLTVLTFGLRDDFWDELQNFCYIIELSCCSFVAFSSAAIAFALGAPNTKQAPTYFIPIVLIMIVGSLFFLFGNATLRGVAESMYGGHWQVTAYMLLISSFPAIATLLLLKRHATVTRLSWCGAMALLSAGSIGHTTMRLITDVDNLSNVVVWCYTPALILAAAGALLCRKLLYW